MSTTTTSLIDELRADERARVAANRERDAAAAADYRELLARAGPVESYRATLAADDPASLVDLRGTMARLGLSAADVEADARTLAEHAKHAAVILTPERRAAAEQRLADAADAVRAERRAAVLACFDAGSEYAQAETAADAMRVALSHPATPADRPTVAAFAGKDAEWSGRLFQVRSDLRVAGERSAKAAARLAEIEAANPRLFCGADGLAAVPVAAG